MPQYHDMGTKIAMDSPVEPIHPLVGEAEETQGSVMRGIDIYRNDMEAERNRILYLAKAHEEAARVYRSTANGIGKFLGMDEDRAEDKPMPKEMRG